MDYSVPEEEPAAVNRLDFTTPNVRTAKPLNSAYLDPLQRPRADVFRPILLLHNKFNSFQSNLGRSIR